MKPVSKTAFYCCGVRMQDAESNRPLVGDQYARRLMGTEGMKFWESFKNFKKANSGNIMRHHLIDQHVAATLRTNPQAKIFLIGAGMDSRAYRFSSGQWFEFDDPAIINYKNEKLPVEECRNSLTRISIDFTKEELTAKIQPFSTTEPVLIIVEGVILYLSSLQLQGLLEAVGSSFPHHTFICELMTKNFFNVFGKKIHRKIAAAGTSFQGLNNRPNRQFLTYGYRQKDVISAAKKGVEMGYIELPKILNHLFPRFLMGYSVYRFELGTAVN